MTPEQENQLLSIKLLVNNGLDRKYRRGAAEHAESDPLSKMPSEQVLNNTIEELYDALIYLHDLRMKNYGY